MGFTYGFDTPATVGVVGSPFVPAIVAVAPATGVAVVTGVPAIPAVAFVPGTAAT